MNDISSHWTGPSCKMKVLLLFFSLSGMAGFMIFSDDKIYFNEVCWATAAVVKRQSGPFDLFGQVFSSFRKFDRADQTGVHIP